MYLTLALSSRYNGNPVQFQPNSHTHRSKRLRDSPQTVLNDLVNAHSPGVVLQTYKMFTGMVSIIAQGSLVATSHSWRILSVFSTWKV